MSAPEDNRGLLGSAPLIDEACAIEEEIAALCRVKLEAGARPAAVIVALDRVLHRVDRRGRGA